MSLENAKAKLQFFFDVENFQKFGTIIISRQTQNKLENAKKELNLIRLKYGEISEPLTSIDLSNIYKELLECISNGPEEFKNKFNTRRKINSIFALLDYNDNEHRLLCYTNQLVSVLDLISNNIHVKQILLLFNCLIKHWLSLPYNNKILLIKLITEFIDNYDGKNVKIINLKKNKDYLLNELGNIKLTEYLNNNNIKLSNVLELLNISESIITYEYFSELAEFYTSFAINNENFLIQSVISDVFDFLKLHNFIDTSKKCLTEIVLHINGQNNLEIINLIKLMTMILVGDPADSYKWNLWKGGNETDSQRLKQAKEIINNWINEEVLRIFFEKFTFDTNRKNFWLQYYNYSSKLKIYCHPSQKLRLERDARLRNRIGSLKDANINQSVLLFEIKDYVFVEFSELGNAFYAYKRNNKFCPYLNKNELIISDLKKTNIMKQLLRRDGLNYYDMKIEGRYQHKEGWEYFLKLWIQEFLGIEKRDKNVKI